MLAVPEVRYEQILDNSKWQTYSPLTVAMPKKTTLKYIRKVGIFSNMNHHLCNDRRTAKIENRERRTRTKKNDDVATCASIKCGKAIGRIY